MKTCLLASMLLLGVWGCPPRPPPVNPTHVDMSSAPSDAGGAYEIPACVLEQLPITGDSCDGWFNKNNNLNCVICKGGQGCLDTVDVVYCINGTSCGEDPACVFVKDGSQAAKPTAKRKITLRHGKMELVK